MNMMTIIMVMMMIMMIDDDDDDEYDDEDDDAIYSLCWPELANYGAECNMPASEFHNITFRSLIMIMMKFVMTTFILYNHCYH